jgi:ribosomal-protein-alanine N-acetyltransferase
LLDDTLAWASREGLQRVLLDVRRSNDAALALYLGAGFVQAGERRRYYSDPVEDALLLERRLPFSPKIGA